MRASSGIGNSNDLARLKPTKIFGGLVSVCATSDIDACAKDAVAIMNRGCWPHETSAAALKIRKRISNLMAALKSPFS